MKLEVENLACGYEEDSPVLEHLAFTVRSGEICCVLGPNGTGKSTLFNTLLGLREALDGRVLVDRSDVSTWDARRLAETMAYVPQKTGSVLVFPTRVRDAVLMGRLGALGTAAQPSDNDYHIVANALFDMGVYDLRDCYCSDISGGELELVLIARALAQQPRIIFLDEPAAALDYGNAVRVIAKLRQLAERGMMVVMTTHSPDHAFMCQSNVLLLQKHFPMKYGRAVDIITERNMKQAYGIGVKIVEFVDARGHIMRMCAPQF